MIGWDIRPFDIGTGNDRVIKRILKKIRNGSVILLHDPGRTPAELVRLIDALVTEIKAREFTIGDPEQIIGKRAYQTQEEVSLKEPALLIPNCFGPGLVRQRWFLRPFVSKIASNAYVRRALEKPVTLDVFKTTPGSQIHFWRRVCLGELCPGMADGWAVRPFVGVSPCPNPPDGGPGLLWLLPSGMAVRHGFGRPGLS